MNPLCSLVIDQSVSEISRCSRGPCVLRAPHYTTSERGVCQELFLSSGGVLVLDELESFKASSVVQLCSLVAMAVMTNPSALPRLICVPTIPDHIQGSERDQKQRERMRRIKDIESALRSKP